MVPYYSVKWTEWNIRTAVKNWRQDPIRNFGISVEVEDEDGNLLPVNRFFKPMNCTPEMMQLCTYFHLLLLLLLLLIIHYASPPPAILFINR